MNIEAMVRAILNNGGGYELTLTQGMGASIPDGTVVATATALHARYRKKSGRGVTVGDAIADLTVGLGLEVPDSENNCDSCGEPLDPSQPFDGHRECREQE